MGPILLLISTILKIVLSPILYLYGTVRSLQKGEWSKWNEDLAIAKDQYGNGLGKYMFNDVVGKGFGNIDETISSRLGKNKKDHSLTFVGRLIAGILNDIEKNHVEKAVDLTEE